MDSDVCDLHDQYAGGLWLQNTYTKVKSSTNAYGDAGVPIAALHFCRLGRGRQADAGASPCGRAERS